MAIAVERTSYSYREVAEMWGISLWIIRRLVDSGKLKSVNIGALQRIPKSEVQRVELQGIGTARTRKAK